MAPQLAFDDRGIGRPVVLLPGAGDVRSEHRFLAEHLAASGHRVVTADLPGHGGSAPAVTYGVEQTAAAITSLIIDHLAAGPAVVVGCSFAPAAAVWAATERPDAVAAIVAISPHFEAGGTMVMRLAMRALLRGPWVTALWTRLYRGWYKGVVPADLDSQIEAIARMVGNPIGRRAVRETLLAHRDGVAERIDRLSVPSLTVFGSADDHFADPVAEARSVAGRLGGRHVVVEGAGHYPHVERPELVAAAVAALLAESS